MAGLRQVVETIDDQLLTPFRLGRERPPELTGFQARLAAQVSWHNFCIWFNGQWVVSRWPLPICLLGKVMLLTHTKRSSTLVTQS